MPPRSTWKGFIKLSLVSVPVQAYTATSSGGGEIRLNQLHEDCHSRIQYRKVCPVHGEVSSDGIVKGYEFAKGQYAIINLAELDKLRSENDKSINIDKFIRQAEIDPVYYSGKAYYLTPNGPAGQKPYALLQKAMADEGLAGIAEVVLFGREQLVLLRPAEKLLCMDVLNYDAKVKKPSAFEDDLAGGDIGKEELKLTKMLIEATLAKQLDLSQYADKYTERLTELIQAKVEGKEVAASPREEAPSVINLMEALKASVKQAQRGAAKPSKAAAKKASKKKMAGSAPQRKTARKKKKTG